MSGTLRTGLTFGLAVVLGLAIPALFMMALSPSLERGRRMMNYRGREVYPGLGVVWLVWAGCAIVCGSTAALVSETSVLPVLTLLGPLALVAFALGLVDDAYGNSDDRGFRGHFRALVHGRMTTGMLKLVGIGAAALVVALVQSEIALWGAAKGTLAYVGGVLVAAVAIALTTNLVNLTDLRPGRALKVYSLLVVVGVLLVPSAMVLAGSFEDSGIAARALESLLLAIALLGPVIAVWRYDLGERAMLGDAGANAMGAVAGALVVLGLPWWGLVAYALVLLGLNAVSECVSFSSVIERTPVLRWIDRVGRLPEDAQAEPVSNPQLDHPVLETPSTPRPETAGSRYDSNEDTNDRKA